MTHQRTAERDAIASLERADPVDLHKLADQIDLTAAHERVRGMIAADGRRSARPRRTRAGIRLGGAAAIATAATAVAVVLTSSAGPEVQSVSAMTIKRATEALQAIPGTILHVDFTGTSSYPDGHSWSWSQDSWQQQGGAGNVVILDKGAPGTPAGTETATINGADELYDAARNTIYVAPRVAHRPLPPGVVSPGGPNSFMVGFADQLRKQLASGQARVDGHATIDGEDTIKIVFAENSNTYYVAADGSYAPVELVGGTPTGKRGMTTLVFHAYERLPASGHGELLSLTARHPTATVDNSLSDYRAAIARLFLDG